MGDRDREGGVSESVRDGKIEARHGLARELRKAFEMLRVDVGRRTEREAFILILLHEMDLT